MRKLIIATLICLCAATGNTALAQYNKHYFVWMGHSFLVDNRYQDAIETLNILLKVDSNTHEGYFLRGIAKFNLNDLLGAEMDFSTAIEKNPVYTEAYLNRAVTRARLGNYDDALKDFQEAIDLRPDRPHPYYSRGHTYVMSKQYEKAIADFDQFIKQQNRVSEAYILRGICYLNLKDTTRAYEEYNQAIRVNRENPDAYNQRGQLYMERRQNHLALEDFDMAIKQDSTYLPAYFNRAVIYSQENQPMKSLADLDKIISLDPTNSLTYFNRALIRTEIGDYNRALEDYNYVSDYNPTNVLVYYNRALLLSRLGEIDLALKDYDRAIELYPDFANAYINRSALKYNMGDMRGSKHDYNIAERKINEYRSKLRDSTYSIYADTSRRFNRLLSFDSRFKNGDFEKISRTGGDITLRPLFKFTLLNPQEATGIDPHRYYVQKVEDFKKEIGSPYLALSNRECDIATDSLLSVDKAFTEELMENNAPWQSLFKKAISQSLIRQYTSAVNNYSAAIEKNPTNAFLYINRSTAQSEMTDFISSMDNSYQHFTINSDPANQLKNTSRRTYNYDEAIADLNKAAKLMPEFAYIYYNRANLLAISGEMPEAYDDYTLAISLNPNFAEAYYNRGLIQIYMKDTRKGCLDLSKAGELGINEAYTILKRYAYEE